MSASATALYHNHLQLFGLSYTDEAASLFLCARELIENALDATRGTHANLTTLQDHHYNGLGHNAVPLCSSHRVDVSLQPLDETLSRWRLRVVDDGCGFSDSDVER